MGIFACFPPCLAHLWSILYYTSCHVFFMKHNFTHIIFPFKNLEQFLIAQRKMYSCMLVFAELYNWASWLSHHVSHCFPIHYAHTKQNDFSTFKKNLIHLLIGFNTSGIFLVTFFYELITTRCFQTNLKQMSSLASPDTMRSFLRTSTVSCLLNMSLSALYHGHLYISYSSYRVRKFLKRVILLIHY